MKLVGNRANLKTVGGSEHSIWFPFKTVQDSVQPSPINLLHQRYIFPQKKKKIRSLKNETIANRSKALHFL